MPVVIISMLQRLGMRRRALHRGPGSAQPSEMVADDRIDDRRRGAAMGLRWPVSRPLELLVWSSPRTGATLSSAGPPHSSSE
jgi:hypothetical protein